MNYKNYSDKISFDIFSINNLNSTIFGKIYLE